MRCAKWLLALALVTSAAAQINNGGGGGSSAFNAISTGTNTTATMTVGTGGTLTNSGSGTINATFAPQNTLTGDVTTSGGGGTATTLAAIGGSALTITSPAAGDVFCYLTASTTGNCPLGVVPNAQTGTTYTVASTDRNKYLSFSNAGAIAVTLPQAGSAGFTSNFHFTACDIGAGAATITPTTSTISYSDGASYTTAAPVLSTGKCIWVYSDNTNYFAIVRAGGAALSAITAAAGANTIANGNNVQNWNWAETTNTQAGMNFGETSAATNGTSTASIANQSLVSISTAAASTAAPFNITQGSNSGSTIIPALQVQTTWNNGATSFAGIVENVTNTASATTALLIDLQVGGTSEFKVDRTGFLTTPVGGGISTGPITASSFKGTSYAATTNILTGADSSSTGSNTAGNSTIRGPDETGASGVQTGGILTLRGGDVTSNNSGASAQGLTIRPGRALNGAAAGPVNGPLVIVQPFVKGAAGTVALAACFSADNTVTDCASSATNPLGVVVAVNTNAVDVQVDGVVTVNFPSATPSAGWYACTGTLTAGTNNIAVQSTVCTAGQQVGIVTKGGTTITSTTILLQRR